MGKSNGTQRTGQSDKPREDRLKAALKANMAKRKNQARARAASDGSQESKKG